MEWPQQSPRVRSCVFFTSHPLEEMSRFFPIAHILPYPPRYSDWASRSFPLRASNEGRLPFSPARPCGAETPHVAPGQVRTGFYCFSRFPLLFPHRPDGWTLYCAHCPSTFRSRADSEHECSPVRSMPPPPSLPPRHLISFFLQTTIDEIRVGLVGLAGRTDGRRK